MSHILVLAHYNEAVQESFFPDWVRRKLEENGDTVEYGVFTRDEVREKLAGVDILYSSWGIPVLDDDLLAGADRLKLVCYTCGSVADFMTKDTVRRGIRVLSGNRFFAASVAEGTIGYMLMAQRRLKKVTELTETEGWAPLDYNDGLRFKTVGIIGFGMIARNLLRMLPVFGCRIKVCSDWYTPEEAAVYGAEKCSMEELFSTCDIVSLHESLTPSTHHMIGKEYFDMMKEGALFVNTARGAIIVEEDLAKAVASGHIRAILDVYEKEPLPMDSPLREILKGEKRENLILISHQAGPTVDVRAHITAALIDDMRIFQKDPKAPLEHEISWEYAQHMTSHK